MEIKPATGWDVRVLGAVRYVKTSQEHKIKEGSNQAEAYRAAYDQSVRDNNNYLYDDPSTPGLPPEVALPQGGFYHRTDNRLLNYYVRGVSNYMKNIDEVHIFNVMVGGEMKDTERRTSNSSGFGIQYDRGNVPFIDYRIIKQLLERGDTYFGLNNTYERQVAFFGTAGYNYDGRYTVNLTGRYDGSNRMGRSTSARWLPTWNVSGCSALP